MVGKIALVVLAWFSISSWMVIVYKFLHLRQAMRQTNHFVELCNQGSGQLEGLQEPPTTPTRRWPRFCARATWSWKSRTGIATATTWRPRRGSSGQAGDRARAGTDDQPRDLAPGKQTHFPGHDLQRVPLHRPVRHGVGNHGGPAGPGVTGGNSLNSLLPGLATALLTVAGGLVCAIPASTMFNYFTHQVSNLISRMDAFAMELNNVILKELMKQPYTQAVPSTLR